MNSKIAINLTNVSKLYKLYSSRRDRLLESISIRGKSFSKEFWALKDISFEIEWGKTVGILGLNGSGKSTLLQIISSVLQPTTGEVKVNGRVAALLELGAGFNPSLSGRENVVIQAMLAGLSKRAAEEQVELIQAFADIGEFFDQPVKIYSSGMFMRVAFASAIHVDPDILIIDEALSVGDAKFQEKCFRRFRQFQESGKTIILVSHDRTAIPRLCNVALLLHKGCLLEYGTPKKIVEMYSNILATGDIKNTAVTSSHPAEVEADSFQEAKETDLGKLSPIKQFLNDTSNQDRCNERAGYNNNEYRYGNGQAQIIDYLLCVKNRCNVADLECGETLEIYLKILSHIDIENPLVGISIRDTQGVLICGLNSGWLRQSNIPNLKPNSVSCYKFSLQMNLRPGPWFLELAVAASQSLLCDIRCNVIQVDVLGGLNSFDGLVFLENTLEVFV